ncbi:ATP-binding protein [Acinetobacter variabilis]|uniref:ATP-binding protein n=1 Tax=Acinetobacter variabilis TaxID=70346 RepID=UPI0021CD8FC5|nr:ATP-binding protein [Acinetobacter variabilis]MCU4366113.1 ATP-binding protein [Acinetobacter variabilis]MCU4374131.1 ATP-binding protein [Acinetobacter variabilis]
MNDLLKDILQILKNEGPLKARKIATHLDVTRRDVNAELYKANINGLVKDENDVWHYSDPKVVKIFFDSSSSWLNASNIEQVLKKYPNLLDIKSAIEFHFADKPIFLDCILKILSLTNQLALNGSTVTLMFEGNSKGFSYLDRCGFIDQIQPNVIVLPHRPNESSAKKYNSNSENLVEIFPIKDVYEGSELPRLKKCISGELSEDENKAILGKLSHLITELITNIRDHGKSELDGYVALQTYNLPKCKKIVVSVSDSGPGLLVTLRNEASQLEKYKNLFGELGFNESSADIDLLTYILNKGGISRTGMDGRGMGLERGSSKLKMIANKNNGLESSNLKSITLSIRQRDQEIIFPYRDGLLVSEEAKQKTGLTILQGTHYVLTIILDKI